MVYEIAVHNGFREGAEAMKVFTMAAMTALLIAVPAHAQMGGKRGHSADQTTPDPKAKKADEKAYKAALDRIPDSKEKYDPWGVARPAEPAKKP